MTDLPGRIIVDDNFTGKFIVDDNFTASRNGMAACGCLALSRTSASDKKFRFCDVRGVLTLPLCASFHTRHRSGACTGYSNADSLVQHLCGQMQMWSIFTLSM